MIARETTRNIFEAIERFGHDEDFVPSLNQPFEPTQVPAGSQEKIAILRWRLENGLPLWHDDDNRTMVTRPGSCREGSSDVSENESLLAQLTFFRDTGNPRQQSEKFRSKKNASHDSGSRIKKEPTGVKQQLRDQGHEPSAESNVTTNAEQKQGKQNSHESPSRQESELPPLASLNATVTAEPGSAQSAAADGRPHGYQSLRPPTEEELRLLTFFRNSVGRGITLAVLEQFLKELRAQGVDVSRAVA